MAARIFASHSHPLANNPTHPDRNPPPPPQPPLPPSYLTPRTASFPNFSRPLPLQSPKPGCPISAPSPIFPIFHPGNESQNSAATASILDDGVDSPIPNSAIKTQSFTTQNTIRGETNTGTLVSPPMVTSPWPKSAVFDTQRFPYAPTGNTSIQMVSPTVINPPSLVNDSQVSSAASTREPLVIPMPLLFPSPTLIPPTATSTDPSIPPAPAPSRTHSAPFIPPYTPALPTSTSTSSKFDIQTPSSSKPLPPQPPYTQILHYASTYHSTKNPILPWPPLAGVPQLSRILIDMLTRPDPLSQGYLLQVCEESLMALRHELEAVESAARNAQGGKVAVRDDVDAFVSGLVPVQWDGSQEVGDLATTGEVECRHLESGNLIGDVKGWIGLRDLARKQEDSSTYAELCQEKERKKWQVRSLKADAAFLKVLLEVEDAVQMGVLEPIDAVETTETSPLMTHGSIPSVATDEADTRSVMDEDGRRSVEVASSSMAI